MANVIAKYLIDIGVDEAKVKRVLDNIDKRLMGIERRKAGLQSGTNRALSDQLRLQQASSRARLAELKVQQQSLRVEQQRSRVVNRDADFKNRAAAMHARVNYLASTGRISQTAQKDIVSSLGTARTLQNLRNINYTISRAVYSQRQLNSQFSIGGMLSQKMAASTKQLVGGYVGAFAAAGAATSITQIGMDFESMHAAMIAATGGDADAAQREMDFLTASAKRLGMNLKDSTDAYIKFRFAAQSFMSEDQMHQLFTGMQEFGRTMGVDPYRMNLAMQAIQQMSSKGVVSMEELRRQLGESLP